MIYKTSNSNKPRRGIETRDNGSSEIGLTNTRASYAALVRLEHHGTRQAAWGGGTPASKRSSTSARSPTASKKSKPGLIHSEQNV